MSDQDTNTHNLVILVDLRFRVLTQSVGCVTMVTVSRTVVVQNTN